MTTTNTFLDAADSRNERSKGYFWMKRYAGSDERVHGTKYNTTLDLGNGYKVAVAAATIDFFDRTRDGNEDTYVVSANHSGRAVLGVFDGVGGFPEGERASSIAGRCIQLYNLRHENDYKFALDVLNNTPPGRERDQLTSLYHLMKDSSQRPTAVRIKEVIDEVHTLLTGNLRSKPDKNGYTSATTAAVLELMCSPEERMFNVYGQGNAQVYKFRLDNQKGKRLLPEDTMAGEKYQKGTIFSRQLPEENRITVTAALGSKIYKERCVEGMEIQDGDCFLLYSDGFEIENAMKNGERDPFVIHDAAAIAQQSLIKSNQKGIRSEPAVKRALDEIMDFVRTVEREGGHYDEATAILACVRTYDPKKQQATQEKSSIYVGGPVQQASSSVIPNPHESMSWWDKLSRLLK